MKKTTVTCDHCQKEIREETHSRPFEINELAQGVLTVQKHFCDLYCLADWAVAICNKYPQTK